MLPSRKRLHNYGKWKDPPFFMGTFTINGGYGKCPKKKLLGGFKHLDYCPFHIWDNPNPIDFHIVQNGYCTTNQKKCQLELLKMN